MYPPQSNQRYLNNKSWFCPLSAQNSPMTPISLRVEAKVFTVAHRYLLPLSPFLFLLQPHWLPCLSWKTIVILSPQRLCTGCFLCRQLFLPGICMAHALIYLKCHLLSEAFSDIPVRMQKFTPTDNSYLSFLLSFPPENLSSLF